MQFYAIKKVRIIIFWKKPNSTLSTVHAAGRVLVIDSRYIKPRFVILMKDNIYINSCFII